jgi:hypothetical protein
MGEQFVTLTEVSRRLNFHYRRLKKLARTIQPAAYNGVVRLYKLEQFDSLLVRPVEVKNHMARKIIGV